MTRLDAGLFAIDWRRTVTDEVAGLDPASVKPGAAWRWHGPATRLDGAPGVLPLGTPLGRDQLRNRVRRRAQRLGFASGRRGAAAPDPSAEEVPRFSVTDGSTLWEGDWMPGGSEHGLLLFEAGLPPEAVPLWIVAPGAPPHRDSALRPRATGFVTGTPIATPLGPRAIETLSPGDAVLGDNGATSRVLATVGRRVSAEHLAAEPDLRPIRVVRPGMGADALFVAPGQRMRVTGAGVEALFGAGLTLAEAADLVGLPDVSIPRWSGAVGYYTLTVAGSALVAANGLWCEPLRPRPVDGRDLAPFADARRLLSPCEAALLAAAP